MGWLSGVLSLALLVRLAIAVELSAPLLAIMDYYDATLRALLGWADPIMMDALRALSDRFSVDLTLQPHWRHVFVLMSLYFIADIRANWRLGRTAFAISSLALGALIALATSFGIGVVGAAESAFNEIFYLFPVSGIVLFELGRTLWIVAFRKTSPSYDAEGKSRAEILAYCLANFVAPVALAAAVVPAIAPRFGRAFASPGQLGLIMSISFVLLLSTYWLCRGVWLAFHNRNEGESWRQRFVRSGGARSALGVYATISGVVLYLSINAGLNLVGL